MRQRRRLLPNGVKYRSTGWGGYAVAEPKGRDTVPQVLHKYGSWSRTSGDTVLKFVACRTHFLEPHNEAAVYRVAAIRLDHRGRLEVVLAARHAFNAGSVLQVAGVDNKLDGRVLAEAGTEARVVVLKKPQSAEPVEQEPEQHGGWQLASQGLHTLADAAAGAGSSGSSSGSSGRSAAAAAVTDEAHEQVAAVGSPAAPAGGPHNLWAGLGDAEVATWLAAELREELPADKLMQALLAQLGRAGLAAVYADAVASPRHEESLGGRCGSSAAAPVTAAQAQPLGSRFILLARQRLATHRGSRSRTGGGLPAPGLELAQGGAAAEAGPDDGGDDQAAAEAATDVEAAAQLLATLRM